MPTIFTQGFTVVESAIDAQGHVNNLSYLHWMQDVAIAHSAAQGWPMQRYLAVGAGWVVRSHFIEYLRPAFLGDQLRLATWIAGFSPRSSPRKYLFWKADSRQPVAKAETLWVYVDLHSGHPRPVPDDLRAAFHIVADEQSVLQAVRDGGLDADAQEPAFG